MGGGGQGSVFCPLIYGNVLVPNTLPCPPNSHTTAIIVVPRETYPTGVKMLML